MRRAYFDTCVAIYYVENHPVFFPRIKDALFPVSGESVVPAISDLTRMECRIFPVRTGNREMLDRYDGFFDLPATFHAAIDRAVFDLATELRATHSLKTPDALHLAAAIHSGCDELWSNDGDFAQAAANRIRLVIFDQPA